MPATSPRLSKCMSVWLSLSDKADTPQKQLSDACLRPNLSPCCKYVISMNKGRFQTGFARRRAIVICFFSPAPSFSLSTDKLPPVSFCCYTVTAQCPHLTGSRNSYLCLLTSERRDIFGGIPSSSVAPLGPDPSFLLFREFSLEEVGGSILPSTSRKN